MFFAFKDCKERKVEKDEKIFAIVLTTIFSIGNFSRMFRRGNSITVAVPNDATNEARALLLLQEKGYITLKRGCGYYCYRT